MPPELTDGGKKIHEGLLASYHEIHRESPTFCAFFADENASKNRFPDIPLNDHTRVVLSESEGGDYYHASYVDGLVQSKQFVLAQAPFTQDTEADFHRLVAELKPEAIIVLMKEDTPEAKLICPEGRGEKTCAGIKFRIEEETKSKHRNVKVSVTDGKSVSHKLQMFFMSSWIDEHKIPEDIWEFRAAIKKKIPTWPAREAAALIVSQSGTKRTGVWFMADTEADRLQTKTRIRFSESIRQLRYQRHEALESFELFVGLVNLMEKFAKQVVEKQIVV
uniref:Tyrosine-protein phosphatase domain-containing protein n=1 Tax=Bursaphelenchus xylophilus TaxID=6326 RepID=A0A1I7RXD3_BURXY